MVETEEIGLYRAGLGYKPAWILQTGKRKYLLKFKDGKTKWVPKEEVIIVDNNDFAWKAKW